MSRAFAVLLFTISIVTATSAQNSAVEYSNAPTRKAYIKSSRAYSPTVTTELRRQQRFLQKVAARYEAVSVHELTPMLSYSYVWKALRENREGLVTRDARLSADQSRMIERGYDLLETDVLLLFVDHQLSVLNETLELDEAQYTELEKILSADLNQKRALLTDKLLTSAAFSLRVQALSDQTEKKLVSILLPEQKRLFHRQLMLNRDRLIG